MAICHNILAICRARPTLCSRSRTRLRRTTRPGATIRGRTGSAGTYWVNTYALNTRPLYVLPSLTAHEAAPGHHIANLARARVRQVCRNFAATSIRTRSAKGGGFTPSILAARWASIIRRTNALAVSLTKCGARAGLSSIPACTRWAGRDNTRSTISPTNTALSTHEIQTEVDRYIGWPGQALAYKMGR